MPTYDYKCNKCGKEFELFQSMSEQPLSECPDCQGPVKRLIGPGAGLIFKGSGFYITDYRSKSYQEAAKKDTSGSASSDSGKKEKTEKKGKKEKKEKKEKTD